MTDELRESSQISSPWLTLRFSSLFLGDFSSRESLDQTFLTELYDSYPNDPVCGLEN